MRHWGLLNNRYVMAAPRGLVFAVFYTFFACFWVGAKTVCMLIGHEAQYNKQGFAWCARCDLEKEYTELPDGITLISNNRNYGDWRYRRKESQ